MGETVSLLDVDERLIVGGEKYLRSVPKYAQVSFNHPLTADFFAAHFKELSRRIDMQLRAWVDRCGKGVPMMVDMPTKATCPGCAKGELTLVLAQAIMDDRLQKVYQEEIESGRVVCRWPEPGPLMIGTIYYFYCSQCQQGFYFKIKPENFPPFLDESIKSP